MIFVNPFSSLGFGLIFTPMFLHRHVFYVPIYFLFKIRTAGYTPVVVPGQRNQYSWKIASGTNSTSNLWLKTCIFYKKICHAINALHRGQLFLNLECSVQCVGSSTSSTDSTISSVNTITSSSVNHLANIFLINSIILHTYP